jgi:hypothetical protein
MSRLLRAVQGLLLLLMGGAALAQSTDTIRYIDARDHAIKESKPPYEAFVARYQELETTQNAGTSQSYWETQGARLGKLENRKLSSLEKLLRQAVGPFAHDGFGTRGTINLHTLYPELGFGRLDGLEYKSRDGRTQVLVTTRPLLSDWLGKFYERPTDTVQDLIQVLSLESREILTQAWAIEDQHFTLVDRLSVSEPKGTALAVAFLGELCAEDENYVPNSILAAVVIGERVYLISQSLAVRLPVLDECDRQWQKLWDLDKYDAAALAFNQCYASRVASTPGHEAALLQAQQLIDRFAH